MADSLPPRETTWSPLWPWACLIAALAWVAFVRVPLVLNAEVHLDSDLAVDGLTLIDAIRGRWRWHFPGTPHVGVAPILLAMPGAWLFGANAMTLVVGGVLAYEAVVVATFLLCKRAFGARAAAWSLVPLAFSSVGTIWLSGRLTGGHLPIVAWYAGALAWLHACLSRGGAARALGFGIWCGFGLYLDQMFLTVLPPIAVVALSFVGMGARLARQALAVLAFVVGFAIGDLPREVGYRVDPYDSYQGQFDTIVTRHAAGPFAGQIDREKTFKLASQHARLLALDCLPRLITGHLLHAPDFRREPRSGSPFAGRRPVPPDEASGEDFATIALTLGLFLASALALLWRVLGRDPPASTGVAIAMVLTSALVGAGFLFNKNIFNSDNYRYLVLWLVPWPVGFALLMEASWRRGTGGKAAAAVLSAALALLTTRDAASWYRDLGWLDGARPARAELRDPAYTWLKSHPEVGAIFGDYWDVYRLQFLLGGRVVGVPYPVYPDRFDAANGFPARRPTLLIGRKIAEDERPNFGPFYIAKAREDRGEVLYEDRGLDIIDWHLTP